MRNRGIYDIGTTFLYFQCFVTTDMFLFSISIIPEDLESSRRDLAFASVKTRFQATLKNVDFCAWIRLWAFVMAFCRSPTKISFDICSKQVLTMRNRFFILPKPEKLNYNEFLRF